MFTGHTSPKIILSLNCSLLLMIAYFNIRLSLPPEAYRNFSSALNFKPSHDFAMSILSAIFSCCTSINCMLCTLCPLLVTAKYFLVGETAIFNGRSPSGKLLPTGVRLQPFGNFTAVGKFVFSCDKHCNEDNKTNTA